MTRLTDDERAGLVQLAAKVDSGCSVCVRSAVARLSQIFPEDDWARLVWRHANASGNRLGTLSKFVADCEPDEYL